MYYRIIVNVISGFGNPREITTVCKDADELKARKKMYADRYPNADVNIEQIHEEDPDRTAVPE